jgi:hypothetical protein
MLALVKDRPSRIQGCLSSIATPDTAARRRYPLNEPEADLPPYLRDACTILQSEALRRLAKKPQVISFPSNAHVRNRLTHVLGVVSIASAIGSTLGLNVTLCASGAYGHDLGHVPYGHLGERFLRGNFDRPFRHEAFGVVVAQHIERAGRGLNLTHQTLKCMCDHSRGGGELHTNGHLPEADVVMFADKIDYIFSDGEDFFERRSEGGVRFLLAECPYLWRLYRWFGRSRDERVQRCVSALCEESAIEGRVSFQKSETAVTFAALKDQMYIDLYEFGVANRFECPPSGLIRSVSDMIGMLRDVSDMLRDVEPTVDPALLIALMTDEDIERLWGHSPREHDFRSVLQGMSIADMLPFLRGTPIEMNDPDLDW